MYDAGKAIKCIHDPNSQAMFTHIVREAAGRGMLVNYEKTSPVCFSAATSFEARESGRD